jgi:hypothetical protein
MKPLHLIIVPFIALALTACGSSTPETPTTAPETPKTPAIEQPMTKESNDILDLRMEEALEELNTVE